MGQIIYANDPGKPRLQKVGVVSGEQFIKRVDSRKHLLRVVKGYAIQVDVLERVSKYGATTVIIIEKDTGLIFQSKIEDWYTKGGTWSHGHGLQRTLSTQYMQLINERECNEKL